MHIDVFYKRLNSNDLDQQFHIYNVTDEVLINGKKNIKWDFRQISNIIFDEKVIIENVDLKYGIWFFKCEFRQGIYFNNVKITSFNSKHNTKNCNVLFSSCKSRNIVFSKLCRFHRGVYLEKSSKIEGLNISNTSIGNGGLKISDCSLEGGIYAVALYSDISIYDSVFRGALRLESTRGDFTALNSNFKSDVKFWNIQDQYSFTLNRNIFEDTFDIKASRLKTVNIHGDVFRRKGVLENRDDSGQRIVSFLNEIFISEASFLEGFDFDGMGKSLKKVNLSTSPNFTGVLRFKDWTIKEALISGLNNELKIIFNNVNFRWLLLNDFLNHGELNFDRCGADKQIFKSPNDPDIIFRALNTEFGRTKFSEFDFRSFDLIDFSNVSFEGIEASNVTWFQDSQIQIDGSHAINQITSKRKRVLYRQIKQSIKKRGDNIDGLIFHALEMKAYRNELRSLGKNFRWEDRMIMFLNSTNNYGLSWWKPTWIILLITLLFYFTILLIIIEELEFGFPKSFDQGNGALIIALENLEIYWQMFNPARKFSSVYGENVEGIVYFLDMLHRLILGIFIFQIIKAFRKFVSR